MTANETSEIGLLLDGLRCSGCAHRIERELRQARGVHEATVNYTTHRALVRFDPSDTDVDRLAQAIQALGYTATPYDPEILDRPTAASSRRALARVVVAGFFAGNVMVTAFGLYLGEYQGIDEGVRRALRWLAIALTLPVVTWCAAPFWRGAWQGLRRGELTVDVPIVLGVGTAFASSLFGTITEAHQIFLDSAAMIVFLILIGRTLEGAARTRAAASVERLLAHSPPTAIRRTGNTVETVAVDTLVPGDRVIVAAGQSVPVDGLVRRGETELDESLLTGESIPVHRSLDDIVTGGTRNLVAEIEVEVTATHRTGTLARLAALLEHAQAERPRIQRQVDRVAAYFAPAVLTVTVLVAGLWIASGASLHDTAMTAAAVLIVACPCALALATPAAVTAALGRAASLGILFKSGEAIERCARIDSAILDKTGTVTTGNLSVVEIAPAASTDGDDVLRAAVEAEGQSSHPIAAALRREASARAITTAECESRRTRPGLGVETERIVVGARTLLEEHRIAIDDALDRASEMLATQGTTLAWVASDGKALGVIGLADLPRPDANEAIRRLRGDGVRLHLVSGDHEGAVRLAARHSGIDDVVAHATPEQKIECVRGERARGRYVLVAGDGINDAAAMGAADVAVAFARGADVAVEAADVVIHAPRLGALADTVELSRATLRRIRQGLGFAVTYNAVAMPLAAAGILDPLLAALAMSLSSILVTSRAVQILRWRPRS